jgi:hypothetical protein
MAAAAGQCADLKPLLAGRHWPHTFMFSDRPANTKKKKRTYTAGFPSRGEIIRPTTQSDHVPLVQIVHRFRLRVREIIKSTNPGILSKNSGGNRPGEQECRILALAAVAVISAASLHLLVASTVALLVPDPLCLQVSTDWLALPVTLVLAKLQSQHNTWCSASRPRCQRETGHCSCLSPSPSF